MLSMGGIKEYTWYLGQPSASSREERGLTNNECICEDKQGLYTPPHIPVGLHLESGRVQLESWSPSTIFSLVATQPNISLESTWSLPRVRLPSRWTHLDRMDSTSEHRELLINPTRVQMESSQINNCCYYIILKKA